MAYEAIVGTYRVVKILFTKFLNTFYNVYLLSPQYSSPLQDSPDQFVLEEGQERFMVARASTEEPGVQELCAKLVDWINDVLEDRR